MNSKPICFFSVRFFFVGWKKCQFKQGHRPAIMLTRINATTTTPHQNSNSSSSNTTTTTVTMTAIEIQLYPDRNCRSNSTFFQQKFFTFFLLKTTSVHANVRPLHMCNLWQYRNYTTLISRAHTHACGPKSDEWTSSIWKQHQCRTNQVEKPVSIINIVHTRARTHTTSCCMCCSENIRSM